MPAPASAQTLTEIKTQLTATHALHKKAIEEKADKATVDALQRQVDALDVAHAHRLISDSHSEPLLDQLKSNEDVSKLLRDKRGTCVINLDAKTAQSVMQRKATMTETGLGFQTTGVMGIDRIPGIVSEARQVLTIRDVLFSRPTTMPVVDFVYVSTPMTIASPVPEASLKPEEALVFTSKSEKVRTIAAWIPASKQVLDDLRS